MDPDFMHFPWILCTLERIPPLCSTHDFRRGTGLWSVPTQPLTPPRRPAPSDPQALALRLNSAQSLEQVFGFVFKFLPQL